LQGRFILEYAVLTIIAAAAMVGMGVYLKRSLSGKWQAVGDVFGHGRQYEPNRTTVR
jgi:Flp pilus assembly pilin Flp